MHRGGGMAKEAGVEPAEHAIAHSSGFEVRAPHRDASLFHLPSYQGSLPTDNRLSVIDGLIITVVVDVTCDEH
jgi:hypothetical protein